MLLIAIAMLLIISALVFARLRVPVRHRWRRRQARAMSVALRGPDRLQPAPLIYARLRAMDALAFEELLLDSFAAFGFKILRNASYSGDGGIDGRVVIAGDVWLIQAKRYAGPIRPEHVQAFATLCAARGQRGLFVHTGRTGPLSRACVDQAPHITIISGRTLLDLPTGDRPPMLGALR
jgi:restriction system protein